MALKSSVKKSKSRFKSYSILALSLVAVGTVVTVTALQQNQDIRQQASSTNVPAPTKQVILVPADRIGGVPDIPNPVCGGSGQGSVCPTMRSLPSGNSGNPNQGNPNQGPNQNQPWNPNPSTAPGQIAPGEPAPNGENNGGNNNGGNNGGNNNGNTNGLLARIIEMLNQILQMLQQLLGGGNPGTPNPGNPNPGNPNPGNPNPGNPQPSQNPGNPNPGNPNPGNPQPSQNPGNPNPGNPQPSTAPSAAPGDTTPPSAPTNLKATATSESQINLTWSAATDNSGQIREYEVYRSEGDARNPGGNTGITFQRKVGTARSYSDTSLKAGTTYYYYVRAFDPSNNRGEHSNTAGATTKAKTPAKNVLKVTVGLSGQTSLKDKRITIQVDGPGGFSKSSTQGNTVNKTDSYSFTGLANGKYTVHVSYGTWNSQTANVTFDKSTGDETISKTFTLKK